MNQTENLLTLPDLLERSWEEIRKRFVPFFLLALCAPAATWLIQGLFFGFNAATGAEEPALWASIVCSVLTGLLSAWMTIAFVLLVCKRVDTIPQSWKMALHYFPRFLAGMLVYMFIIGFALTVAICICWAILYFLSAVPVVAWMLVALWVLFFIVLFFAAGIYWFFLPYLLILSDLPILACFATSYQLIKGRFWHTIGALLILSLISFAVSIVCLLAIGLLGIVLWVLWPASTFIISILGIVPVALATLIFQVPMLALYLDYSTPVFPTETPSEKQAAS